MENSMVDYAAGGKNWSGSYSYPLGMEKELAKRKAKILVKTEKQILSNIIKNDKRYLMYVTDQMLKESFDKNKSVSYLGRDLVPRVQKEVDRRRRKKLVKTEKQLLFDIIKNDERHLKYGEWFKLFLTLKKCSCYKKALSLIDNFFNSLPKVERNAFLIFIKEQTK